MSEDDRKLRAAAREARVEENVMTRSQQIKSALQPEPITVGMGWIARMPRGVRKGLEWALIAGAIGFLFFHLTLVRKSIDESALATLPPVDFLGDMEPDREEYYPGDVVRLHYIRNVHLPKGEPPPLPAINVDAFENIDNGILYPATLMGRIIEKDGKIDRIAVRQLPEHMEPGVYIFEGWMRLETQRRSAPVPYKSKPFRVLETPKK